MDTTMRDTTAGFWSVAFLTRITVSLPQFNPQFFLRRFGVKCAKFRDLCVRYVIECGHANFRASYVRV